MMRLRAGVVSDCGHVRSANEDSFLLRPGLYAVCDGMGGARAGEVASQMACVGLLGVDPDSAGVDDLRRAIIGANRSIVQRSITESELLGMGTTLTAAMIKDETLFVAHVGDSRAYLFRDGGLTQMTADHSWVGEMLRRGEITASEAARHPHRSVITKALGTDQELAPDVIEMAVEEGDRILLCSDGLTGMVDDATLAEILGLGTDAQATAQALVDAALANGGEDNVTVVVVDVRSHSEGEEGSEVSSWSDARILVGPSNREASVSATAHGKERLSMAARERLRRRGMATVRPGSRPVSGPDGGSGASEAGETSEADSGTDDAPEEAEIPEEQPSKAVETKESPETVPPPKGEARKKGRKSADTSPPRRRRRALMAALLVLLVLVLAVGSFAWYNSSVYYLGEHDGQVALYRGLPWEVLGIEFSSVYRVEQVDQMTLSPYERTRLETHELVSKEEGERFLDGLSTEP